MPLTRKEHEAAHASGNDEEHFRKMGLDARSIASALWSVSGDTAAGMRVIFRARQTMVK